MVDVEADFNWLVNWYVVRLWLVMGDSDGTAVINPFFHPFAHRLQDLPVNA